MSTKHNNPYRAGQYHDTFSFMMNKQVFTGAEVLKFTKEKYSKEKPADVTVLLSPRLNSKRGDCRGNISAQGHLYYIEKCSRQIKAGVKEPQKFRLRWRTTALAPRKRESPVEVKSAKVKTSEKVVSPATVAS